MFKRTFFTLGALLIALVLVSSAAADGPPWPAEVVINEDGGCIVPWRDPEMNYIDVPGTATWEYQPKNGVWNVLCRSFLDFDDPNIASIDEVCAALPGPYCRGDGTIAMFFYCLSPWGESTWGHAVTNRSGNLNTQCHFRDN